jgi:WD40 repeat protein
MQSEIANFEVKMIGLLKGHNDWVTSIIVSPDHTSNKDLIISGSRDRTILLWTEFENPVDDLAG